MSLGIANKLLEPFAGAVLGKIVAARRHHPVHPEAAARPVRAEGPGGRRHDHARSSHRATRPPRLVFLAIAGSRSASWCRCCIWRCRPTSPFHISDLTVALLGKYLCYALLALSLDLVWGYCGILSLGHGAFFALGGYAMGMYLMRQIGTRGVYGNPILPDFMVFLNWKELPWYWYGFDTPGSPC